MSNSSIAKNFPILELLPENMFLKSPVYAKMLKRSCRDKPDPKAPYKTYAVTLGSIDMVNPHSLLVMFDLDKRWPKFAPRFRSQIALVSCSFIDAFHHASGAFAKDPASTKSFLAGKTFSGTVLVSETKETVCYSLTYNEEECDITDCSVLWLDCRGFIQGYLSPHVEFFSRRRLPVGDDDMASMPIIRVCEDAIDKMGKEFLLSIENYILFCHFADVDVKIVARPGSREARRQADDKDFVVNDTHCNVRRLTANYYTTICRDESFPVRGHFRMQPFGVGRAERKLIYISPFVKNGYHRRAELLKGGEFGKGISA